MLDVAEATLIQYVKGSLAAVLSCDGGSIATYTHDRHHGGHARETTAAFRTVATVGTDRVIGLVLLEAIQTRINHDVTDARVSEVEWESTGVVNVIWAPVQMGTGPPFCGARESDRSVSCTVVAAVPSPSRVPPRISPLARDPRNAAQDQAHRQRVPDSRGEAACAAVEVGRGADGIVGIDKAKRRRVGATSADAPGDTPGGPVDPSPPTHAGVWGLIDAVGAIVSNGGLFKARRATNRTGTDTGQRAPDDTGAIALACARPRQVEHTRATYQTDYDGTPFGESVLVELDACNVLPSARVRVCGMARRVALLSQSEQRPDTTQHGQGVDVRVRPMGRAECSCLVMSAVGVYSMTLSGLKAAHADCAALMRQRHPPVATLRSSCDLVGVLSLDVHVDWCAVHDLVHAT